MGRPLNAVFPEETAREQLSTIRKTLDNEKRTIRESIVVLDGQERLYRTVLQPLPDADGATHAALILAQDITEDRRTEDAIIQSEEKYRALADLTSDGVCVVQDFILKYANPSLEELLGRPISELIGTQFTQYVHQRSLPILLQTYNRHMDGERNLGEIHVIVENSRGDFVEVTLTSTLIRHLGAEAELVIVRRADTSAHRNDDQGDHARHRPAPPARIEKLETIPPYKKS